jgi:hypothetical protein
MPALVEGALLRLQSFEDEAGGKDLKHGSSWSEGSVDTRTPDAASEEDDDGPPPSTETLEEAREKGCCGTPPQTPRPRASLRHSTAELTQDVPTLLDRMNRASDRVNCLEREAGASEARYRRRIVRYDRFTEVCARSLAASSTGASRSARTPLASRL